MSIEEFNETGFYAGKRVLHKGEIYDIVSVDFDECLIGIEEIEGSDELQWKRCENCYLLKKTTTY